MTGPKFGEYLNEFINKGHPIHRDLELALLNLKLPATFPVDEKYEIWPQLVEYLDTNYDDLKIIMDNLSGIPELPSGSTQGKPMYFCMHKEHGPGVVITCESMVGFFLLFIKNIKEPEVLT